MLSIGHNAGYSQGPCIFPDQLQLVCAEGEDDHMESSNMTPSIPNGTLYVANNPVATGSEDGYVSNILSQ